LPVGVAFAKLPMLGVVGLAVVGCATFVFGVVFVGAVLGIGLPSKVTFPVGTCPALGKAGLGLTPVWACIELFCN